jgi:ketosteroid isomerase-like protein
MHSLKQSVQQFIVLVEQGNSLQAMQQFYAEDVVIFENRELARAGREQSVAFERNALANLEEPPSLRALRFAADEASGTAFIEWRIRFRARGGRPMRLEEVAVQKWERGLISEERFYYEGLVDEGDPEEGSSAEPALR